MQLLTTTSTNEDQIDHPHTPCTLTDIPDYCKGYNKGYSDEVVAELD